MVGYQAMRKLNLRNMIADKKSQQVTMAIINTGFGDQHKV